MSKIKLFGSHLVDIEKLPERPIIIDVGACQGNFIEDLYNQLMQYNSMINPFTFAIEPNRANAKILREKYHQADVIVIEAALVGSTESATMEFNEFIGLPEWGNVTGLYENRPHITYEVDTIDLKELLMAIPYETIDILKMDIEGNEHQIVQDMTKNQAERIKQITMEVHNGLRSMPDKLKSLGYDVSFENGELYAVWKKL